jgi:hypothetical protein
MVKLLFLRALATLKDIFEKNVTTQSMGNVVQKMVKLFFGHHLPRIAE